MAEFIYQMYRARRAHGDKVILDDVTMGFFPGAKIGVVGPNGMGKSTLLKVMAGMEEVTAGEARLSPGYTVGILQQEPPLDEDKTVIQNIEQAFADTIAKVDRFNAIGEEMADPDADFDALMEEMGRLQDEIDAANGWDLESQLSQAMDALQCPDPDAPVSVLSGGERRRVALCRLLLEAPDLLLLDEPTNHLDAESVLWLEQFLHLAERARSGGAEHADALAGEVACLEEGLDNARRLVPPDGEAQQHRCIARQIGHGARHGGTGRGIVVFLGAAAQLVGPVQVLGAVGLGRDNFIEIGRNQASQPFCQGLGDAGSGEVGNKHAAHGVHLAWGKGLPAALSSRGSGTPASSKPCLRRTQAWQRPQGGKLPA